MTGNTLFIALYLAVGAGLFLYGLHAWWITLLHVRTRRRERGHAAVKRSGDFPVVTVQLPVFNERHVVRRLIDAVAAFDWPHDRLEIQLLDDSTDETVDEVARIVARHRERGVRIVQLRRSVRTGFKGGALREGLAAASGEFIAVFDADFVPPPDFLLRAIAPFRDPGVGMVQARWGHLNENYSLLTRTQAMALDGHFVVEQAARNSRGAWINFNGTAGVWRRTAIEDAGNWQDDTLTEDLDLSYRAQLKGWRFRFLPDLVCPAELPADIDGFKGQQFRWAKGSVQTAMKLLPALHRTAVSPFVRLQGTIHLTNHVVYPLLLLLALMTLPASVIHAREPALRPWFNWTTLFMITSFGHPVFYLYSQSRIRRDWPRQLLLVPALIALGMGIALNNSRAFVEAAAGVRSPFHRTPKHDVVRRGEDWRAKGYRLPPSGWAVVEIALGLWCGAALLHAVGHGQWLVAPFLALYTAGFLGVGGASLRRWFESIPSVRREPLAGVRA